MDRKIEKKKLPSKKFAIIAAFVLIVDWINFINLSTCHSLSRAKEIGIRKVLGISVTIFFLILSKDFLKWVLLANLIAWPITWNAMDKWLQNFAYRISIQWWIFPLAGALTLLIVLLTISWQAIRAAMANPVEALRYE